MSQFAYAFSVQTQIRGAAFNRHTANGSCDCGAVRKANFERSSVKLSKKRGRGACGVPASNCFDLILELVEERTTGLERGMV